MRLGLLSAAWLAGVLLGLSLSWGTAVALLLAGAAILTAVGLWLARLPIMPAVLAALLLLGMARAEASQADGFALDAPAGREVVASGRIADDPESTATRVRFELQVTQVLLNGESRDLSERWLVYAKPVDDLVRQRDAPFFRYGDEVTVQVAPQQPQPTDGFDYPAYLAAQGISATLFAQEAQVTGEGGMSWRATLYAARGRLADSIERAMPFPESAVGTAMLLGKRESLPPELVDKFRDTGAAHLLAISGLHVGVLLAATAGAAAWLLGRHRPTYLIIGGVAVWLYVLTSGASPSALRAAVMGTVYLAALGLGRPSGALPALALAAALMTAASPNLVRQISFQLSFAAVGGIAIALAMFGGSLNFFGGRLDWGSSPSSGWVRRLAGGAAAMVVVSASASLATWPLAAANFGQVALLSVPVSLLTVPAMSPLIVATLAAAVSGAVFAPLGELLGWIATAPAAWVIGVVSAFPSWTVEADWVGRPLLLAWYGGLGLVLLAAQPHRVRRWRWAIAGLLARLRARMQGGASTGTDGARSRWPLPNFYLSMTAAVALGLAAAILWARAAGGPDGNLHVHFLDIGQGDSILVVAPSGRQALIDGGPYGDTMAQALADVLPGGDRSLDLMVMTHLDSDHSRGLLDTLDRYAVGAVLSGPQLPEPRVPGNEMQAQWEQRLKKHNIQPVEVSAGYVIELDDGVEFEVLNPQGGRLFRDFNNDSVTMRLTYGDVSFLLTADIEEEAEERLLMSGAELHSTVMKVAHHGSNTSTTQQFLDAVNPAIAVVSAGQGNSYGHPAPAVIERLEAMVGAQNVYRTDLHGSVEVVSDGVAVWVQTEQTDQTDR